MLKEKTVAVIVPAYNEENQIIDVIQSIPDFVDQIIVINDASTDGTESKVMAVMSTYNPGSLQMNKLESKMTRNQYNFADWALIDVWKQQQQKITDFSVINDRPELDRLILINHHFNAGKGAGIATGYSWAREYGIECVATMDGDGQMDPAELESICLPIVTGEADYVKGNRLIHPTANVVIPKTRFLGNSILSILTKLASGYWSISDTQTGYNAISMKSLSALNVSKIYKRYGYPNDILVKLNIARRRVKEVMIKPVYNVGESSKMRIRKVVPSISWLLLRSFFKRLWKKYLIQDFHPIFIFYHLSFILFIFSSFYALKILKIKFYTDRLVNDATVLAFAFFALTAVQFLLFAMWMDIQDNEKLNE